MIVTLGWIICSFIKKYKKLNFNKPSIGHFPKVIFENELLVK